MAAGHCIHYTVILLHAGSWKVWGGGFESGDGEMGIEGGDIYAWVWDRAEKGEEGMREFLENFGLIHILEATIGGGGKGGKAREEIDLKNKICRLESIRFWKEEELFN